jgi:hypothetical protein
VVDAKLAGKTLHVGGQDRSGTKLGAKNGYKGVHGPPNQAVARRADFILGHLSSARMSTRTRTCK